MQNQTPFNLKAARQHLIEKHGRTVTIQTIKLWIKRGCRGVKLNANKVGWEWMTTSQDIQDFIDACTAKAKTKTKKSTRTPAQQKRDFAAATRNLEENGFYDRKKTNSKRQTPKVSDLAEADVPDV